MGWPTVALSRIVVFIDYQNAYMRARECFFSPNDPVFSGQFNPLLFGERLCAAQGGDWQLEQVRIYCGLASNKKDSRTYAARRRQIAAWEAASLKVHVTARPLRYPRDFPMVPAQEKGVDVALAIDCVTMAIRDEYDTAVLMTEDTDLRPALEAVLALTNGPEIAVACWKPLWTNPHALTLPGRRIETHVLDFDFYRSVQDLRDYGIGASETRRR